jgi:WW domain-containing oxidoreductase
VEKTNATNSFVSSSPEGDVYYANHNTRSTQWTHPRTGRKKRVAGSLPFGWDRKILPDGKVVYVDHESMTTTYTDPRLAFAVETSPDGEAFDSNSFRQRFDAR